MRQPLSTPPRRAAAIALALTWTAACSRAPGSGALSDEPASAEASPGADAATRGDDAETNGASDPGEAGADASRDAGETIDAGHDATDAGDAEADAGDAGTDATDAGDAGTDASSNALWSTSIAARAQTYSSMRLAELPGGDVVLAAEAYGFVPGIAGDLPLGGATIVARIPRGGGAPTWARALGSPNESQILAGLAVDSAGRIFVGTNPRYGTAGFDFWGMPGAPAPSSTARVSMVAMDENGSYLWSADLGTMGGVAVDTGGRLIVAHRVKASPTSAALHVTALDASGATQDDVAFTIPTTSTAVSDVATGGAAGAVVTVVGGSVDFGSGPVDGLDATALGADLGVQWSQRCAGASISNNQGRIARSASGRVAVATRYYDESCAGPHSFLSNSVPTLVAFDSAGQVTGQQAARGSTLMNAYDVSIGSDDRAYVVGWARGTITFGASSASAQMGMGWLASMAADGSDARLWTLPSLVDYGTVELAGVLATDRGTVLVAGHANGPYALPSGSSPSVGDTIFVAEIQP